MSDFDATRWREFYARLYDQLDEVTPLQIDCGELCGSACCSDSSGEGVFLFPHEDVMFEDNPYWEKRFMVNHLPAVTCDGECPREERPLACRLFPLFPYLTESDELEIRFYSPMTVHCPLVKLLDFSLLAPDFVEDVEDVVDALMEKPECREFIRTISRMIDDYEAEPWAGLFK